MQTKKNPRKIYTQWQLSLTGNSNNYCWLHTRTKLVLSKHFIQVHLEILSRSVEKIASHLLTKYIIWGKGCQSLCSLKSWNRCTCTSCIWLLFLIGQVSSQVSCCPCLAANFSLFELRSFPCSPSNAEVVTFYPFTLKVGSKYTYITQYLKL